VAYLARGGATSQGLALPISVRRDDLLAGQHARRQRQEQRSEFDRADYAALTACRAGWPAHPSPFRRRRWPKTSPAKADRALLKPPVSPAGGFSPAESLGLPRVKTDEATLYYSHIQHHHPTGRLILVLLRGYFDDSKGEGEDAYLSLAGYIAPVATWNAFESKWQEALKRAGLPWLHLKEFASPTGIYANWYNGQREHEKIACFQSLIKVIHECQLSPIGAIIRIKDVERFNQEFRLILDSYTLALYFCLLELSLIYPSEELELILDRVPSGHSKIALAKQYINSDQYYPAARTTMSRWNIAPLPKPQTFRNTPPIQAADFVAWETRKSATRRDEWFTTVKPHLPPDEWLMSLFMWLARTQGQVIWPEAGDRRSFLELKKDMPIEGQVWDYQALCGVHKARGATWG